MLNSKTIMAYVLCMSMTFNPLFAAHSYANGLSDYKAACSGDAESATFDKTKADQLNGQCAQAKVSKIKMIAEAVKLPIYLAGMTLATTWAAAQYILPTAAVARSTCLAISIAVPAAGMAADIGVAIKTKDISSAAMGAMTSVVSVATNAKNFKVGADAATSAATNVGAHAETAATNVASTTTRATAQTANHASHAVAASEAAGRGAAHGTSAANTTSTAAASGGTQAAVQSKNATTAASHAACESAAISLGLAAGMSALGLANYTMGFDKASKTAKEIHDGPPTPTLDLDQRPPPPPVFQQAKTGAGNNTGSQAAVAPGTSPNADAIEACGTSASKLQCLAKVDPDIARITASPEFTKTLAGFVGGDLNKFVQDAPTDKDAIPGYVANAMGLGSAGGVAMANAMKDLAKISGGQLASNASSSYAGAKKSSAAEDLATPDFNKMMTDMMKALNPSDATATKKSEDVAELAFRQMELLPPEKLMQNKDISLFARIGFRYRKNLNKVDSLLPRDAENDFQNRAPAQH